MNNLFFAKHSSLVIYVFALCKMTEPTWLEVPCTRGVTGDQFVQGVQDYPFSIGAPNVWYPKKSYFKVEMSLYKKATPQTELPLQPRQLTAFADNAVGNLYDNAYFRGGEQDISSLTQYCAQASALKVRMGRSLPWLKSMGSAVAINESSFQKRMLAVSQYPGSNTGGGASALGQASLTGEGAYDARDIYRPYLGSAATPAVTPENFAGATLSCAAGDTAILGVNTDFVTGMPLGSAPVGGSVLPGDILVISGVPYIIRSVTDGLNLTIASNGPTIAVIAATTDWFIVRSDPIRAPQAFNKVFAIWQPPLGIFDYDEELGSGNFRIQLNPNSNYALNAVETKDPNFASTSPYYLKIESVRFYAYVEKKKLDDQSRDLFLNEMSIQSKAYSTNLQFSVPPSTTAISIFVQDITSGASPLVPPSMFKILDSSDLYLKNIQVNYASITKPSTNWDSLYQPSTTVGAAITRSSTLELQQRYHDTYEESGLDVSATGMETLTDWLRRGPFYHFSFERDVNNKSTEVQINTVFTGPLGVTTTNLTSNSRVFIVAWYRKTVQMTIANGLIVNVASREV